MYWADSRVRRCNGQSLDICLNCVRCSMSPAFLPLKWRLFAGSQWNTALERQRLPLQCSISRTGTDCGRAEARPYHKKPTSESVFPPLRSHRSPLLFHLHALHRLEPGKTFRLRQDGFFHPAGGGTIFRISDRVTPVIYVTILVINLRKLWAVVL